MPLMPDISTHGFWLDYSLLIISLVTLIVAVLSFALIIAAVINFRQSKNPRATRHLSGWITRLIVLDITMIIFDIVITVYSTVGWAETILKAEDSLTKEHGEAMHVNVVGRQFFWSFNYPGPDKIFDTSDDFSLANDLVVPKNKLTILHMTSGDTIHSFFVPHLRVKYDVIPGRETRVWFVPTDSGEYPSICTELCGLGHYQMLANLRVLDPGDYDRWLNTRTMTLGVP
jgi:cytochrome c oxidase subunit 2